jgi:DNA-binding beta-propeller fold protein YncE
MYTLCLIFMLAASQPLFAQSSGPYRITHTYILGGEGRWDYVIPDPPNHRVFIARSDRFMVVGELDGKLLGTVTGFDRAHGVVLVPSAHHAFGTSGGDSSVVMFDPSTLKTLGRTHAAEDCDAIAYDPVSNRVFTFNGDAHSASVIDPVSGHLVKNIPLGGKPETGVAAGNGMLYVNIESNAEIVEIDGKSLTVTRRWSTAPASEPVAMAIDTKHHRLFSGCRSGKLVVSDLDAGKVIATEPIGSGVDGAAYDAASGDIFASNADGTLTVIHEDNPDKYHVVQNLHTGENGKNMGLDPVTHRLYVVAARFEKPAGNASANARRRAPMVPGSFMMMVIERTGGPK